MEGLPGGSCALCGKAIGRAGTRPVTGEFNGIKYGFDRMECLLAIKKLEQAYGPDFPKILN